MKQPNGADRLQPKGIRRTGFQFLGFEIRQFPVGKYQSGKNSFGKTLGFKTIITPSKEKALAHYQEIKKIVDKNKSAQQKHLITRLNPLIRGWARYYSTVSSTKTFSTIENKVFRRLVTWAKRRHPNKSWKWVKEKYWHTLGNNNWKFSVSNQNEQKLYYLFEHTDQKINRHTKVKGSKSPYDGDWTYWSSRMSKYSGSNRRITRLLKKQKGKCALCKLHFTMEDVIEVDHILPKSKGGKDEYKNLQLLHRHCHDQKTALDGSYKKKVLMKGANQTRSAVT